MKSEKFRDSQRKYNTCCIPKSKTIFRDFRKAYLNTFDHSFVVCYICLKGPLVFGKPGQDQFTATIDHMIPPNKGGSYYSFDNFAIACYTCNSLKGDKLLEEIRFKSWTNPSE